MGGKDHEVTPPAAPPPSQPDPTLDTGDTAGAAAQLKQKQQAAAAQAAGSQKPAAAPVEQFGRIVVDPSKLATDDVLAQQPRTNLWDELTKSKPPQLPRIDPNGDIKNYPGAQKFLSSFDCAHYPGDSGMLAIYDKNDYGGKKPILDLTAGNIVGIHKEGDLSDPKYLTSPEHLDAVLKGALMSKIANQPPGTPKNQSTCVIETPAADADGKPSLSKMIMAYAAEKTGLHAVGSDGKKIDTSIVPAGVKDEAEWKSIKAKMDANWDSIRAANNIPKVVETFNPAANPAAAASPAPAAAPADPNKPMSAKDIGQKAIDNATKRFAGADVNISELSSVQLAIHDQWGSKLMAEGGLTGKAKEDTGKFLEKINDGTLKGDQLVQLVTDYQKTLKADGFDPSKDPKNAQLVENISMATQAFAAQMGANGVDPKLYHQFQPDDGLTNAQLGIGAAPAGSTRTAAPVAPTH